MRGNGDDLGALLAGLNYYLQQLNPKLLTLQEDLQKTAVVANIYADAGPDLVRIFDNAPGDQRHHRRRAGQPERRRCWRQPAWPTTEPRRSSPRPNDYIAAVHRLRAPLKVAGEYSPEFGCILKGTAKAVDRFAPIIGGIRPGLFVSSNFLPGSPAYTYPESLPIVNASGGPNCRGLPDVPSKQFGGSWYSRRSWSPTTPTSRTSRTPSCSSTRRRRCSSCSTVPTRRGTSTDEA